MCVCVHNVWLDEMKKLSLSLLSLSLSLSLSPQTSSKRKKEQERSLALIEKLQEEKQRQEDNYRLVSSCIKQEKDSWFTASELSCDSHMIPCADHLLTLEYSGTGTIRMWVTLVLNQRPHI